MDPARLPVKLQRPGRHADPASARRAAQVVTYRFGRRALRFQPQQSAALLRLGGHVENSKKLLKSKDRLLAADQNHFAAARTQHRFHTRRE